MDNVGAEVGQKMRSAIKAKLLELNCYVDDELPDYIMVMVANKRTKSQMNEDLNLFLNTKTSTFVEWLHIVLKKLKEVTVTNPEVYKKVTKRKSSEGPDIKVKKEKKSSKKIAENIKREEDLKKSLTDNLPMNVNRLSEQRKVTVINENENVDKADDGFDIPLLSEVTLSSEKDLEDIERKIRNVKSRLGLMVDSDLETEIQNIKFDKDKFENESQQSSSEGHRIVEIHIEEIEEKIESQHIEPHAHVDMEPSFTPEKIRRHTPIIFDEEPQSKRTSVLDRLGKKTSNDESEPKRQRIIVSEFRRQEDSAHKHSRETSSDEREEISMRRKDRRSEKDRREKRHSREKRPMSSRRYSPELRKAENKGILSRLGVMSKIHIPQKEPEELDLEDELKTREVRSMVQVKPRKLPLNMQQPNKNLLLKAVAEAHRSVAQATKSGTRQAVKRRLGPEDEDVPLTRKLSHSEKVKLRNMILAQVSQTSSESEGEDREMYIPKPLQKIVRETANYVPSSRKSVEEQSDSEKKSSVLRPSIKSRLEAKKSPSPIVFDRLSTKVSNKLNVPDRLPIVHPPLFVKNKERCKYWPNCRQGDKCEFVHPSTNCELFPSCRFGDKCIYLHPSCKFGSSCTKRDCPYSHSGSSTTLSKLPVKLPVTQPQICKFFPKCANITCSFYHPKLCRFGKYCKNQADCSYSHALVVNKTSLTWRSK